MTCSWSWLSRPRGKTANAASAAPSTGCTGHLQPGGSTAVGPFRRAPAPAPVRPGGGLAPGDRVGRHRRPGPTITAVRAGATGVLRARPGVDDDLDAKCRLSAHETHIIQLVADGHSTTRIARELAQSALTVKSHLARIGRRLGSGDRAAMIAIAMRAGVIT